MVRIKNPSLAGERLSTQYGTYYFDANGEVEVPEELAQRLLTISGFTLVETPDEPPEENSVTLEGGVVWTRIDGGYVVSNDDITFTVTGSGVDSYTLPPSNVVFYNGTLSLDSSIDVGNVHVKGITSGDTIQVGANQYKWADTDNNLDNGLELELIPPVYTLSGGGSYTALPDGGYKLFDAAGSYSIISGDFDVDHISIQNGKLVLSNGIDTTNLHVIGVTADDTIQVGDATYKWVDLDNNLNNGYELEVYDPYTPISGGGKYLAIEGGYVLTDDTGVTYTVLGDTLDTAHISIQNGKLVLSEGVDVATLTVVGVTAGDTIQVGDATYKWVPDDTTPADGMKLELVPHIESLPGGGEYHTIEGGYVIEDSGAAFTVAGDYLDTEHIGVSGGNLVLQEGIDTANLHVIGVTADDTIQVGDATYKWVDLDNNLNNGYELEEVIPTPPEPEPSVYTLSGGGSYTALPDGGYKLFDAAGSYSIISGDFDVDHISIQDGKLVLSNGIDTANLHVIGVTAGDTIQVGDTTYIWKNIDSVLGNGLELEKVDEFEDLPAGGKYAIIQGRYVVTDGQETFVLVMGTLDIDTIGVKNGKLMILPGVNISDVHIVDGVSEGDTIQIGEDIYKWEDTDLTTEGYELVLVPQSPWTKTESSVIYHGADATYTLYGSAVDFDDAAEAPTNVSVVGGVLQFDPNIDTAHLSVKGVEENSTIKIGDSYYMWMDSDNNLDNGLELVLIEPEEIDGFEYDFDGKKFTVEGGMDATITADQLNAGVNFDEHGNLVFDKGIVSSLDGVHIQGLENGSVVKVNGENYTLLDADSNLSNGYELVGGTEDAFDWKWSNRNKPAEPQLWRHYTNGTPDIKVQGVSARPAYSQPSSILTLLGTEITSVTNSTTVALQLSGDIDGTLAAGALFTTKNGIISGGATSYVYLDGTLYVTDGTISGISGDFEFTLADTKLTITSGNLDATAAVVTGTAITEVTIGSRSYSVSGNKLIKSAFTRRKSIKN